MTIQNSLSAQKNDGIKGKNPGEEVEANREVVLPAKPGQQEVSINKFVDSVAEQKIPTSLERFKPFITIEKIFNHSLLELVSLRSSQLVENAKLEFSIAEKIDPKLFNASNGYTHERVYEMTGHLFAALNRYKDALPYSHNIVALREPVRKRFFKMDINYLNGSYIDIGGLQFVACSAPMPLAFEHFWSMIMEQETNTIVMLTKFEEDNKIKAHQYFPDQCDSTKKYGSVSVSKIYSEISESTTKTLFKIEKNGEVREVFHYQYEGWPDMGKPETTSDFMNLVDMVGEEEVQGKIVVHCSAGLGRAGTFIIALKNIYLLKKYLNKAITPTKPAEEILEVYSVNTLKDLLIIRSQRKGMVQSFEQYHFIKNIINDTLMRYVRVG